MIDLRPFAGLGAANHGWLDAHFHFSFSEYYDPARMGWGALRVWNDDRIAPQTGFPPHSHRDMEIITYVRAGAITHQDSLGNRGRTEAGDVQVMSAGSGIVHAEYNLEDEETRLFQIWIETADRGASPSWGTRPFPRENRSGRLIILASGFAEDEEALSIRTPARVMGAWLKAGESVSHPIAAGRYAYLVPSCGQLDVNGVLVSARDGAAAHAEAELVITAREEAEFVLVDTA